MCMYVWVNVCACLCVCKEKDEVKISHKGFHFSILLSDYIFIWRNKSIVIIQKGVIHFFILPRVKIFWKKYAGLFNSKTVQGEHKHTLKFNRLAQHCCEKTKLWKRYYRSFTAFMVQWNLARSTSVAEITNLKWYIL